MFRSNVSIKRLDRVVYKVFYNVIKTDDGRAVFIVTFRIRHNNIRDIKAMRC